MNRRSYLAAALFFSLPGIAAPNSGIIQVTGLRSWSHPGSTRVIIETTGVAEYRADRAHNPERLFFDILNTSPWIDHRRLATREINDTQAKRVRIAETAPGTTRVVFDLAGSVEYTVSRLDTPDRIVIELTPGGRQAPLLLQASPTSPAPQPLTLTTPRTIHRPFLPPLLSRPAVRMIPAPDPLPPVEFALLAPAPSRMPDAWTALTNVRMVRKQPNVPAQAEPSAAPEAFVNSTTKVLPAIRPAALNASAKASSNASLSLTRALGLKINRIVIDAGHGGHDDGTVGPDGVLEKDVVLDVALRLATLVQTRLGAEVVLTRSDDTFVPLTERTAIANEHKADLFLSIHANSSPAPSVSGTETFLLNLNSSPGAIAVAARENAGSDKSVGELRDLIQSIAQNDKIAESQNFAADIQTSIFAQAAKGNAAARDRGVKKAPFVVLIGARMPSALAEIGFLSNPHDESNLNKPEYRQKIAESLYHGIAQYSQSLSHFEVAGR